MPSLECGICGGPAIEREENLFYEDEGGECITCGFPGRVEIAERLRADDEEGDDDYAYWNPLESDENYAQWKLKYPEKVKEFGYEV